MHSVAYVGSEAEKFIANINADVFFFSSRGYPATPINTLESVLDDIDAVLIMTVNPGFAGQKYIQSTLQKIRRLRDHLDSSSYSHIEIEVDGNVSFENAKRMRDAGANIFIAGTSSIFSKDAPLSANIARLRQIIESE